jgi:hypothetical protein
MHIPVPIAIATCVLSAGTMWYFGTRDTDFTTPPSPEKKMEIAKQWKQTNTPRSTSPEDHSNLKKKSSTSTALRNQSANTPTPPSTQKKLTPPPQPPLPLGDLNQSPQLTEYGTLGDKGSAAIIKLATTLENKGAKQRALLAWERVLDTTHPTENEVKQTGKAIQRLKPDLPPWNPDPTNDIKLILHAGTTIAEKSALEKALQATADIISEASGHLISVKIKIDLGKRKKIETPRTPIAIWFSHTSSKKGSSEASTPPLSFMADPTQEEMLANQCQAAVYALLSTHLAQNTNYSKLPEYPAGVTPEELLKYYVTRLMWREFANSLGAKITP